MMKKPALLLIALVAACGRGDGNDTAGRDSREPVQTADLTGLYEARGEGGQSARMCMISDPSGVASFGIVTESPDGSSCGGAGEAMRTDNLLRLAMTGDQECTIEAPIEETQVTFPSTVPEGCAYYCGPGASLAGETFEKTGGTAADAMRATDLAGDPLCG